ncbi:MAG: hypothetical protein CL928_13005 [Deltaproteobacteria bacterium]|nr:hypothetical protein [Deltaproteobacteria bacterium]
MIRVVLGVPAGLARTQPAWATLVPLLNNGCAVVLPGRAELPYEFGPYRLLRVVGQGGMARVYLAEKPGPMGFAPQLALKVVRRKAGRRSEFVSLLTREAVIGSFLRHPNIVSTLDFDQVDGHYYIAMEFVEGEPLDGLMRAAGRTGQPFPALLGLDILQQICRGLSYAHNLRDRVGRPLELIHRDLKPGNILVSSHGVVKITDFGIAKAAVETGVVTATNVVRGTPLYMSPEQATGQALDHRSDLFTLGLVLYEMLTAKRLFEMKDIVSTMENIARAQIGDAPDQVDAVVPGIGDVLRRLLQLKPRNRFGDAREVELAVADLARPLMPAGDHYGENSSLRHSLRALSLAAENEGITPHRKVEATQRVDPGAADGVDGERIPYEKETIDRMDGSEIRERVEEEASTQRTMTLAEADLLEAEDSTAATEHADPVIRRTSAMLRQVMPQFPSKTGE